MLQDLKRSDWLPVYDEDGFRTVLAEMEELFNMMVSMMESVDNMEDIPDPVKASLVFHDQCLSRDKRYLFAYLNYRMDHVRELRWETGAVLPAHVQPKLSPRENDYFTEYNNLINDYCTDISLDLASDLEPPRDLQIEVRVIQDCGEIMTENGPVKLDAGSTHFLKRTDVEHLIRQGQVEHVHNE